VRESGRLRWEGDLRFAGQSGHGGRVAYQGGDEAPRLQPSDALLLSLGACTAMDVASILAKKRQAVERYEIGLEAELGDEHPKVFRSIVVTHEVEGPSIDVAAVRRSIELSATRYCIVNATLSSGEVEIHHRFRVLSGQDEAEGEVLVTGPRGRGVLYRRDPGPAAASADRPPAGAPGDRPAAEQP
jgi:putative redox protein